MCATVREKLESMTSVSDFFWVSFIALEIDREKEGLCVCVCVCEHASVCFYVYKRMHTSERTCMQPTQVMNSLS